MAAEPANTDRVTGDARVRQQLDELGYDYKVDSEGDFQLTFEVDVDGGENRSQLVFVRSPVETYGEHRIREVWSPAYQADGDQFPAKVANRLLEASQDSKLGAWTKQQQFAVFVVKLSADAGPKELEDAIGAAFLSADAMEAELTPDQDKF